MNTYNVTKNINNSISNVKPERSTGGVLEFLEGDNGNVKNQDNPLTQSDFDDFLREGFTYGRGHKTLVKKLIERKKNLDDCLADGINLMIVRVQDNIKKDRIKLEQFKKSEKKFGVVEIKQFKKKLHSFIDSKKDFGKYAPQILNYIEKHPLEDDIKVVYREVKKISKKN